MLEEKIRVPLFLLRVGVFVVLLMWTLDKFLNPEHTARVFQSFYLMPEFGAGVSSLIGAFQALVVLAFLIGYQKTISYGLVFIMHLISTLSSYPRYLDPWSNLLFFAAWPMLAAIATLYLLREWDTLLTVGGQSPRASGS